MTSELVHDVICGDSNVRILSIREVRHLNERKLQQALRYAVRASRPANAPKLEALYVFGPKDGPLTDELGDKWYRKGGNVLAKPPSHEWARTIMACRGIISFDAVLCTGARHSLNATSEGNDKALPWYKQQSYYIPPRVATYSLGGCCKCNSTPEGFATWGVSPMDKLPLLSPPPLHSFTAKSAKAPLSEDSPDKSLLLRCPECMQNRRCDSCEKWWCEDCYDLPNTFFRAAEVIESGEHERSILDGEVKVHMGLCVEDCLVDAIVESHLRG